MKSRDGKKSMQRREVLQKINAITRQVESGHISIEEGSRRGRALMDELEHNVESVDWIRDQLMSRINFRVPLLIASVLAAIAFVGYFAFSFLGRSAP